MTLRGSAIRRRLDRADDSGFTMIELLVAMMIITAVLLSLMAVQTSALVTTAQSRQRTQGTAIANQVMEELRALPWLVLSKGLHSSFATASGGDANVVSGVFKPTVNTSISETLVTSSNQATDKLPLSGAAGTNKMVDSDPAIVGATFTTRTYVTRSASTADGVLTLSVITSWTANQSTKLKQVLLRSQVYAPSGGCGDVSNQPFLGACQALLSGNAGANGPTTTVTASTTGGPASVTPLLPGTDYTVATVGSSLAGIGITSQQSTTVDASVLHATVSLAKADPTSTPLSSGGTKITNAASNDVGSSGAAPTNPADVSSIGVAAPQTLTQGALSLSLTAASPVNGVAKTSTVASCWTGIPAGQGCGSATTSGGSAPAVTLTVDGAAFSGLSMASPGSARAYGGRYTTAAGATTIGCSVLSGPGCVSAGAERTAGNATFGTGPWTAAAAPSGLATVTSYSDAVRVERGMSQKTVDAVASRTAQVTYWNGTGYTSLTIDKTTGTTVSSAPVAWTSGASTVTGQAVVTVTPAMSIKSNPDPLACGLEGCTIDADTGTVTVAVTWTITTAAGTQTLTASTVLGTTHVSAAYKAAPSA